MGRRFLYPAAMVVAAALVLWWGFSGQPGPGDPGPGGRVPAGTVVVAVDDVRVMDITDVKHYTGSLLAASEFILAPKVGGRVRELLVDIGDSVQAGQVVARLDDEEFVQQAEEARASLRVAQAQLTEARARLAQRERDFERLRTLRRQNLASESELDLARAEYDAARATLEVSEATLMQRQAALNAAEIRRNYTTVRAEWSGGDAAQRVVGERFADAGANVAANDPLITILDKSSLRAVVFVSDRDYPRLRAGQEAEVTTDAIPGQVFPGRVERIAPRLQEDTRQARIEIRLPNDHGQLSPGLFVGVRIALDTVADATVVPHDAVSRYAGQQGVFLVDAEDGVARFQPVTLGVRTADYAQILEPELRGQVVTLGQHRLGHETPIRIAGQDA